MLIQILFTWFEETCIHLSLWVMEIEAVEKMSCNNGTRSVVKFHCL